MPASLSTAGAFISSILEREKGFEPDAQSPGTAAATFSGGRTSEIASSDAPGDSLGRFRDDSFGAALLAANAARGRKLAAFAEVDQDAAGCGLALCRGLDAAYQGDLDATLAALGQAYDALGLTGVGGQSGADP
jgi:hypothetical protein